MNIPHRCILCINISEGFARNVISAKFNGTTIETTTPLTTDGKLVLYTWKDDEGKKAFWHSSAHVLAQAILEFHPKAKLTIGPAIDNGFYYDVDFGDNAISEKDFPAIHAVGKSSHRPPALIDLEFGKQGAKQLTLVGKGVCFDSGGISIKPSAGMEEMKWDMGGSGAVAGAMLALVKRKAKANIVGVVGLVENMPDGRAHEQLEADHAADRISGQPEDQTLTVVGFESPEPDRLSRFYADFVEDLPDSGPLQFTGHQIEFAGRNTA
mgnify:CR=1 FL=1